MKDHADKISKNSRRLDAVWREISRLKRQIKKLTTQQRKNYE